MITTLSLYELNDIVRGVLRNSLDNYYWVVAEVSSINRNSNGHCYLELVERDSQQGLVAKASAHIWRSVYSDLMIVFEHDAQTTLHVGMKVRLQVGIDFHAFYGYSLNVVDIDATYSLGDMARRRREILQQLLDDGVIDLNRKIQLPTPMLRVAVITSETAAGYGDFCAQLNQSRYAFKTGLYPSVMQGEGVEKGVVDALNSIYQDVSAGNKEWDVVVIVRGGGATSDLSGFDSYELGLNIAQFPLPIFSGIGHERDSTVVDRVANTNFKTPTAVAAYLITAVEDLMKQMKQYEQKVQYGIQRMMADKKYSYKYLAQCFNTGVTHYIYARNRQLSQYAMRLSTQVKKQLFKEHKQLAENQTRLSFFVPMLLEKQRLYLQQVEKHVEWASPDRILRMGYSVTLNKKGEMACVDNLVLGEKLQTYFLGGCVESEVISKNNKKLTD